ncbi:hypothetical protein GCM10027269_04030 [Kribbella endophytica]
MSPHARVVITRLERTRFFPGQIGIALREWEILVRRPEHRLLDLQNEGCGEWGCCAPVDEVRAVLTVVEHHLPKRDARRLRARLARLDELW